MVSYPRFTPTERRKLTMSARARESFRAVGIRGGAGPGEGAPVAPSPYYTLSEDDRATFEATMNMTHDNDIKKSSTAKEALDKAFKDRPVIKQLIDNFYQVPIAGYPLPLGFFAEGAWQALNFAGYLTETEWEIPNSEGFCSDGDTQAVGVTSVDIQGANYNVSGGQARQFKSGAGQEVIVPSTGAPAAGVVNYSVTVGNTGCRPVICRNGSVIAEIPSCGPLFSTVGASCPGPALGTDGEMHDCDDADYYIQYLYDQIREGQEHLGDTGCLGNWDLSGTDSNYAEGDDISVGFRDPDGSVRCDVIGNGQYDYTPVLADMSPVSASDLPITDIPLDDLCDIIDDLQNDPALQPYLPPPGTPPGDIPPGDNPVDPSTGLPPGTLPTQPPDPGTNPLPGQPPTDVPTDGECFIDATTISPAAVDALKSGAGGAWSARTNDNAERLYAPQGSDGCRDFDPVDEAGMINALVAEGWTTSAQSGGSGGCSIDATTISQAAVNALTSGGTNPWTSDPNDNQERLYAPAGTNGSRKFDPIDERYKIDALQAEGWMFYEDGSGLPPASWCTGGSGGLTHLCPPASWCVSSVPPDVPPGVPVPGVVPPGPIVPAIDPIDSGIEDPTAGGCMTLSKEPAGFRDPKQAGGIARQYQPGQPVVIDYGEGSKCKTKIVKVKPNAGGSGTDGGPEVCVTGQLDNGGKTTEKTCYGPGLVTDAIQSVLGEMIAEGGSIIFDSDSTRELHRPLCFRSGTSKRVILNKLLDMVGFCVFPMFDCNVIVGYCGPVGVIWTYHEDVDLIKFDLEYDGQEVFDYVEVFRGDFISRAGNVFVRGNSVLYPIGSPASSVNGDRVYQYEVPYSTPDSELNSIAITLAAKLRAQALPEIAFGVPLNSMLALRHQLRIQMPSVGFDAYYMVTRLTRDYDRENGHLSTGLARWLRAA